MLTIRTSTRLGIHIIGTAPLTNPVFVQTCEGQSAWSTAILPSWIWIVLLSNSMTVSRESGILCSSSPFCRICAAGLSNRVLLINRCAANEITAIARIVIVEMIIGNLSLFIDKNNTIMLLLLCELNSFSLAHYKECRRQHVG